MPSVMPNTILCGRCRGFGYVDVDCPDCSGAGVVDVDEATAARLRGRARRALVAEEAIDPQHGESLF